MRFSTSWDFADMVRSPSRLRAATADEPVAEHLLPGRSDLGLHQRMDCANLFLRLLLLFRLLF
jgi:hypothetical protein